MNDLTQIINEIAQMSASEAAAVAKAAIARLTELEKDRTIREQVLAQVGLLEPFAIGIIHDTAVKTSKTIYAYGKDILNRLEAKANALIDRVEQKLKKKEN